MYFLLQNSFGDSQNDSLLDTNKVKQQNIDSIEGKFNFKIEIILKFLMVFLEPQNIDEKLNLNTEISDENVVKESQHQNDQMEIEDIKFNSQNEVAFCDAQNRQPNLEQQNDDKQISEQQNSEQSSDGVTDVLKEKIDSNDDLIGEQTDQHSNVSLENKQLNLNGKIILFNFEIFNIFQCIF